MHAIVFQLTKVCSVLHVASIACLLVLKDVPSIACLPIASFNGHCCLAMHVGRPLMLPGAPLQKLRHSVRSHPLKGVEPELFSPEELLGGARRATPSTSRPAYGSQTPPQSHQPLHRSDSESSDRQQSGSWFQLPWKVSQQDETPQSRRISRDDRGLPLNQPPLVSLVSKNVSLT